MPEGILFTIIRFLTWAVRAGAALETYWIYRQIKHPKLIRPFWRMAVFIALWLGATVAAFVIDMNVPKEWQGVFSYLSNLIAWVGIWRYGRRKRIEVQLFNASPLQKEKLSDRIGALADLIDDIPAVKRYKLINFIT